MALTRNDASKPLRLVTREISMVHPRMYVLAALLPIAIATLAHPGYAQIRTRPAPTTQKPTAPPPTPTPATPAPVATPSKPSVPGAAVNPGQITQLSTTLPTITYGTPQPRTLAAVDQIAAVAGPAAGGKPEPRQLTAVVAGQNVAGRAVHLRGLSDIEQADESLLPEGAKRLLLIHVGKTAANESDHYIVNTRLAAEWALTHDVPAHIRPPPKPSSGRGCSTRHLSWKCVQNEGEQLIDKASEEWERLRQQTEDVWNHAAGELSNAWNEVQGCFSDKTLSLNEIPVQFSIAPSMSIPLGAVTDTGNSVSGSVGLGLPMQGDFSAQLDLFYIPCLPFVIRPKALAGEGTMTVGERLTASVSAVGTFDLTVTIPPSGGASIPIYMIPIVIAGEPVAELDISAYFGGMLQVAGQGKAEASFQLDNSNTVQFNFRCSGSGCSRPQSQGKAPSQTTTISESAGIQGKVFVKPAIYTALELNFFGALSARAGVQPYLLGAMSGCAEVAGQQALSGGPSIQKGHQSHALTADLDWGIELRAEARVGGQHVGSGVTDLVKDGHIWFRDLAPGGSTALVATVEAASQVVATQPATYRVKMPSCYPYTDPVQYRVTWTGDATPTGAGCQWQAGQGICNFDPSRELVFNLTWATPGTYALTVAALRDEHREFEPQPNSTQLEITVAPAG
jgi:hypothetical protein